jgi:MoaA/NifB/PqqE/SkfB family radical SAM enzyme
MLEFFGNGEPPLDSNLEHRLSTAKQKGFCSFTRVFTNGTPLNPARLEKLIDSGLDELHLSLDIMDRVRYREVKKLDAYETVINNVQKAIQIIEGSKSTQLFIQYFKGGNSHGCGVLESDGEKVESFFMESAKSSQYVHLKSQQLVDAGIGFLEGVDYYSKPCEIPFYLLYIKHSGQVSACCTDVFSNLTVGSINESSLTEIILGKKLANIRLKHLKS